MCFARFAQYPVWNRTGVGTVPYGYVWRVRGFMFTVGGPASHKASLGIQHGPGGPATDLIQLTTTGAQVNRMLVGDWDLQYNDTVYVNTDGGAALGISAWVSGILLYP